MGYFASWSYLGLGGFRELPVYLFFQTLVMLSHPRQNCTPPGCPLGEKAHGSFVGKAGHAGHVCLSLPILTSCLVPVTFAQDCCGEGTNQTTRRSFGLLSWCSCPPRPSPAGSPTRKIQEQRQGQSQGRPQGQVQPSPLLPCLVGAPGYQSVPESTEVSSSTWNGEAGVVAQQ